MGIQDTKWLVKVFISSTFNDMHDERDVLMNGVLPRVRRVLSKKGLDVRFVDLRWGVNSKEMDEKTRESEVLKECLGQIDKCRNFFIGLVGDHYGWIPPKSSWDRLIEGLKEDRKEFIKRKFPNPVSVTELEINYGSLIDLAFSMRSLFCFRNPDVYNSMDENSREVYVDSNDGREKTSHLKESIEKDLKAKRLQHHIYHYSCNWDKKQGKMIGLKDFEDYIVDFLIKEIPLFEFRQCEYLTYDTFSYNRQQDIDDTAVYAQGFWGRQKLLKKLEQVFEPGLKPLLFSSSEGVGKSGLLSVIHHLTNKDDNKLDYSLIAFGRKTQSLSMILKKWISDPVLEYDREFGINDNISTEELIWHFHKAIANSGKFILILIDDIDWLDRLDLLPLLLKFPIYTGFFATCDKNGLDRMTSFAELQPIWLESLDEQETIGIIEIQLKKLFGKDPFASVTDEMIKCHYKEHKGYEITLWTRLMIQRLLFYTGSEIREIRRKKADAGIIELEDFFCSIVRSGGAVLPFSINLLIKEIVASIGKNDLGFVILSIIALTQYGVKRSTIEKLLGMDWDELLFTTSLERLGILLDISPEGVISFRYDIVKSIILDHITNKYLVLNPLFNLYQTYTNDEGDKDALKELPFLCLQVGPQQGGKVLLDIDECHDKEYVLPALVYVFSTNSIVIEEWIIYLLNAKDNERSLSLLSSLLERLQREMNVDLIQYILTVIDDNVNYVENPSLLLIRNVCKAEFDLNNIDSSIADFFLDNDVYEEDFPDLSYLWWREKATLIKTKLLINRGDFEQAKECAEDLVFDIKYAVRNNIDLQHFDVIRVVKNYEECIVNDENNDCPELNELIRLPQWVHDRNHEIRVYLRRSRLWKYNSDNDFKKYSRWAFCYAKELHDNIPNNYISTSLYAKTLVGISSFITNFDITELQNLYNEISCYYEDETVESCIEILLYLYQYNSAEFNIDYIRKRYEEDGLDYPFDSLNDDGIAHLCILKNLLNEDFYVDIKKMEESEVHNLLVSLILMGKKNLVDEIISTLSLQENINCLDEEIKNIYNGHPKHAEKCEYEDLIYNPHSIADHLKFIKKTETHPNCDTYSSYVIMELYKHIGRRYMQAGKYEEAYYYMQKSVSISSCRSSLFSLREEFFGHLNNLMEFGNIINYFVVDADDFLLKHYKKILELIDQSAYLDDDPIKNKRWQAISHICKILIRQEDFENAETLIKKSSSINTNQKKVEAEVDILGEIVYLLGEIQTNKKDYESAFEYYNKAMDLYKMKIDENNPDSEIIHKFVLCQYSVMIIYLSFNDKEMNQGIIDICNNSLESCSYLIKNYPHNPFYLLDNFKILTLKIAYFLNCNDIPSALETVKLFYNIGFEYAVNSNILVIWSEFKKCLLDIHDGFYFRGLRDESLEIACEELKFKDYLVANHMISVHDADYNSTGANILSLGSTNNPVYREMKDYLNVLMGTENDNDIKIKPAEFIMRPEDRIVEQASAYRIPEAMLTCCELIGATMPTDIVTTKELIECFPDTLNTNNIMTFVVDAYLSLLYQKASDMKNADFYAEKALLVARCIGESMDVCQAHIYWAKAVMFKDASLYNEAKKAGIKALEIFEQNKIVYCDLPDLYILVGNLYEEDKEYTIAVSYYQSALKIMKAGDYYDKSKIEMFSQHIHHLLK